MKILYMGPDGGTSRHRRQALARLGHTAIGLDPFASFGSGKLIRSWSFRTGALGLGSRIAEGIQRRLGDEHFDLIFVDGGELIGPSLVRALRRRARCVVNYNPDNPFVPRDRGRWRLFHKALPHYDLFVTPRLSSAQAARDAGAAEVLTVQFAADEIAHDPAPLDPETRRQYAADVVFAGTWMPGRDAFLASLVRCGIPLKIYGPQWHKAPERHFLSRYLLNAPLSDREYVASIKGAKIALGLLSHGNHDLHTTRSLEIPAMGVVLCAERTAEHLQMYREDEEAVFWDNAEECAAKCLALLRDPARATRIAAAGLKRIHANKAFNEPLMAAILSAAGLT